MPIGPAPSVPKPRTSDAYVRATWYCTLPHDTEHGEIGFALLPVGRHVPHRFALATPQAVQLLETLALNLGYELKKAV